MHVYIYYNFSKVGVVNVKISHALCTRLLILEPPFWNFWIRPCDDSRKRKRDERSDDEKKTQSKKKVDNEVEVQKIMDSLKSKNGTKYTVMQLRIWAELVCSGLYTSTEEPPCKNSMFQRAEGDSSSHEKKRTGSK